MRTVGVGTPDMPAVRSAFAHVNGLRLHRIEFGGQGAPLICIHGVTGNAWMWCDVATALSAGRQVISVDLRGHGESQWSPAGAYTTDDHVTDLAAVIADLGVGKVDVAGASWGALVGLGLAGRYPQLVRRVALVDVEPSFDEGETEIPWRPRSFVSHADVLAWERKVNPHAPQRMVEIRASMATRPGEGGRLMPKHDPLFFERWPFRSDDRWQELRQVEAPILVACADQSWVRPAVAEEMAREARYGRIARFRECGHLIPVERPLELSRVLDGFLERDGGELGRGNDQ